MKKLIYILLSAFLSFTASAQIPFASVSSPQPKITIDTTIVAKFAIGNCGQSNGVSSTGDTGVGNTTDVYPNDVWQIGRYFENAGKVIPATVPLENSGNHVNTDNGPALMCRFAQRFRAKFPNVTLLIIPASTGGSGFSDDKWTQTGNTYTYYKETANNFFADSTDYEYKGMIWTQGERDAGSSEYNLYNERFYAFNDYWRTDITAANETTPLIATGLADDYISNTGIGAVVVNNVLYNISKNIPFSAYASAAGLPTRDNTHFTSDASLSLGDVAFDEWWSIITSPQYIRATFNNN